MGSLFRLVTYHLYENADTLWAWHLNCGFVEFSKLCWVRQLVGQAVRVSQLTLEFFFFNEENCFCLILLIPVCVTRFMFAVLINKYPKCLTVNLEREGLEFFVGGSIGCVMGEESRDC